MGEKSKDTSHQKINYPNENVKMIFDDILSGLTHSIFFFFFRTNHISKRFHQLSRLSTSSKKLKGGDFNPNIQKSQYEDEFDS